MWDWSCVSILLGCLTLVNWLAKVVFRARVKESLTFRQVRALRLVLLFDGVLLIGFVLGLLFYSGATSLNAPFRETDSHRILITVSLFCLWCVLSMAVKLSLREIPILNEELRGEITRLLRLF